MASFKFRLQSFLNVKEKIEDQRKMEYGQAIGVLEQEKNKMKQIVNKKNDSINSLKSNVEQTIDPLSIQRYNYYIDALKKSEAEQKAKVVQAENKVENKRLELIESMRERKMLDILKEKDYLEFIEEEKKAEQKIIDEIVSYRYNNRDKDLETTVDGGI